ncbi:MAG: HRDC domain-containing protein, partial [Pseudomonadota bacterium]
VTHLRDIYEHLANRLQETGRSRWVNEELSTLLSPDTYIVKPDEAWRRVKTRTNSSRFLAVVKELAAFREAYAQEHNIPRNRIFKDEALIELAGNKPKSIEELGRSRLLLREARKGAVADGILSAIKRAVEMAPDDMPKPDRSRDRLQVNTALADLLRVLLKAKTESEGVAAKLVAPAADLDAIAAGVRDLPALKGWRKELFGQDALRLCDGEIALAAEGGDVRIIPLD